MESTYVTLPEYPVRADMWDELRAETRPIVVYGMGNGADKLFDRLASLGVTVSDIFASDGFVRGHSFRGMRVMSFSEIKEKYSDFVILLSFASNREDVVDMLADIDSHYDMYVPDMPVAGVEDYFDREHYNNNYREIKRAYDSLADGLSRHIFASCVRYKLTGRLSYLEGAHVSRDSLYSLIHSREVRSYADIGAYNGDTVREAIRYFPELDCVTAVEPDPKTYKRLLKFIDTLTEPAVTPINAAAWDSDTEGILMSGANRNSSISSTSSYEHRDTAVRLITLDSLGLSVDYIKYDVEGAELEALLGSHNTIAERRPTLLVSVYHRSRDLYYLTNYIKEKYPFYRLYLRRFRCLPAWELDLIAIAEESDNYTNGE